MIKAWRGIREIWVPFVSTPRGTGSLLEFESQSPDINKLEINQKSQLDVQASV